MEQKEMERFRVIGACVKMQTIYLEDEMRLLDGIPYDINFFQDFTAVYGKEKPVLTVPGKVLVEQPVLGKVDGAKTDTCKFWEISRGK